MTRLILSTLFVFLFLPAAFAQQPEAAPTSSEKAQSAKRATRVLVRDIEGLWLPQDYMDALRATRQPHAAARKAPPLVINIQREDRSYPIMRTDFNKAVLQRVIEVEPAGKPGAYRIVVADDDSGPIPADETTVIPFRGSKGVQGRVDAMSLADPTFSKGRYRDFLRAPDGLVVYVNRAVIAGKYLDERGGAYAFSETGEASFPDGKFNYELSLAAAGATCDYFETPDEQAPGGHRRIGFAWKGDRLELFKASGTEPKNVRCEKQPFAVLKRQD
ncbi:MAG: hypothetical protein ABI794_17040 [Betaproteobacteria bacterium]